MAIMAITLWQYSNGNTVMAMVMAVMAMSDLARRAGTLSGAAADLQPFGPGRRGTGSATPWLRRQWHAYVKAMLSQCDGNGHGNVTST